MTPKVISLPAAMDEESAPLGKTGGAVKGLADLAERYCSAPSDKQAGVFKQLIAALREAMAAGLDDEVVPVLRRIICRRSTTPRPSPCTASFSNARRRSHRAEDQTRRPRQLYDQTAWRMLELYLFAGGVDVQVYEGEYGVFRQEILDAHSRLYDSLRKSSCWPPVGATWRIVLASSAIVPKQSKRFKPNRRIGPLSGKPCTGHSAAGDPEQFCTAAVAILRQPRDASAGQPGPPYHDDEPLVRRYGAAFRYAAQRGSPCGRLGPLELGRYGSSSIRPKMPCAQKYLVDYAHSLASIIIAQRGLAKKCLVLDLDNTVWGGVIGDDGLGGIRLGPGRPGGRGFSCLSAIREEPCNERGVILAVCSKEQRSKPPRKSSRNMQKWFCGWRIFPVLWPTGTTRQRICGLIARATEHRARRVGLRGR